MSKDMGLDVIHDIQGAPTYALEAQFLANKLVVPELVSRSLRVKKGDELYFKVTPDGVKIKNPKLKKH